MQEMQAWATRHLENSIALSYPIFLAASRDPQCFENLLELRNALLDFIADFAASDSGSAKVYLDTGRAITLAAHEALGGHRGVAPLVLDPFAGGGSFPLEALRVGAHVVAGALNAGPFLLTKMTLEYAPTF